MEEQAELFISYAHKDEPLRQHLEQHLSALQRQGIINIWHDRKIDAGYEWKRTIDAHLSTANIILLLISPDFIASDYCYSIEMTYAMQRHERNEAHVIPIILRPVYWQNAPIGKLQALPKDAIPVTSRDWHDLDEAFFCVAEGIRQAIQSLSPPKKPPQRPAADPPIPSPIWNVPYPRNPYFTGRETLLKRLHTTITSKQTGPFTYQQALSGLGGVGKTQIALEYAYQQYNTYTAILWVRADSRELLLADFMSIAHLLHLTQSEQQEQIQVVDTIKQWLRDHTDWLLIFDNVDDPVTIREFIPRFGKGSILITCRMQSLGNLVPYPVEVDIMDIEEGILFLLRRAGILPLDDALNTISEENRTFASTLVQEMGNLPLALDQAGAYIQDTGCSLSHYLNLYKRHTARLLQRRGTSSDYPQSVATTWSLSFQKVEKDNPIAAEMLRLSAFLHPDAIPEELFTEGRDDLGPILNTIADDPITLDDAINTLRRYSLIKRNAETKTLTIHRLVQTVLRDTMSPEQPHQWAERTIRVINHVFPEVQRVPIDTAQWPQCERYLPHAQACLAFIEHDTLIFPEAAYLFHRVGCYLYIRGHYTEAQPFCQHALTLREQLLEFEDPDVAESLDLLAAVYHKQGKYSAEEPLFQRIISSREKTLGSTHPDLGKSLHGLGKSYYRQGKYAQAESVLQRALSIFGETLSPENTNTLSLLGIVYWEQGKYTEAEPLFMQALSILENALGPTHPDVANSLTRLGLLYKAQGKYAEALPLHLRALSILEQTLGSEHRDVAISLDNIGGLYFHQGKYAEAESFSQRALSIFEQVLGPEHDHVGTSLNLLGDVYVYQEKYTEAEQLLQRALTIHKQSLGIEHFRTINDLYSIGNLYTRQKKYAEAEQLLQQALALYEKTLGPDHPDVAESLISLGALYQQQEKKDEARLLLQRALTLQEKVLGPNHPKTLATQEQYNSLSE